MIDGLLDRGEPVPAHLIPPDVLPEYHVWIEAFWELSSERQIGMGYGKIPHSAIRRWSDREGMDEDEAESFLGAIRVMDRVWLAEISKETEDARSDKSTVAGTVTKPAGSKKQRISSRPMSPNLFDALF